MAKKYSIDNSATVFRASTILPWSSGGILRLTKNDLDGSIVWRWIYYLFLLPLFTIVLPLGCVIAMIVFWLFMPKDIVQIMVGLVITLVALFCLWDNSENYRNAYKYLKSRSETNAVEKGI